jgi:hypothetical protein
LDDAKILEQSILGTTRKDPIDIESGGSGEYLQTLITK